MLIESYITPYIPADGSSQYSIKQLNPLLQGNNSLSLPPNKKRLDLQQKQ